MLLFIQVNLSEVITFETACVHNNGAIIMMLNNKYDIVHIGDAMQSRHFSVYTHVHGLTLLFILARKFPPSGSSPIATGRPITLWGA